MARQTAGRIGQVVYNHLPKLRNAYPARLDETTRRLVGKVWSMHQVDSHRFREIRKPKVKPVWHRFNCQKCGTPVREFSDERVCLYLCQDCLNQLYPTQAKGVIQEKENNYDWWDSFVMQYENQKSKGELK